MARISELHYSNAYARNSGISEFLEVTLRPDENPADFTASFYQANGSVGIEIPLTDPGVQVSTDPDNGEIVYVISADFFDIRLTDPDGSGSNNYEAYALTNTATGTVVDFYDIGGGTQNIVAQDGAAAGAVSENLAVLVGPNSTTTTLQFNQPDPDTLTYDTVSPGDSGLACFTAGTLVETTEGLRPIESLQPGDLVLTRDDGAQPICWVGQRQVCGEGRFAPIEIEAGVLGAEQILRVSPQHRILISGWQNELLFGCPETLVPAIALVNGTTVRKAPQDQVTYVHIMFERHQLLTTHGLISESFFPGEMALNTLDTPVREELFSLFPELRNEARRYGMLCRPGLSVREGRMLQVA